ncbi:MULTISPECIES: crotonase/enoyl-CoA hydratase family protein [Mycolicibacter]|uniref:crotonase/enoyl-CoA hydratase family protein n=1 Tax=Mycolicibacter TaxID=1073531 RepID=UPI00257086E9|nr:crotonase/enoyl-CoA hydratase family protein [Mycolicibacter senuensis]
MVLVDVADGVADVRLNRPEVMNAFNDELFEALIEAGQSLRSRPDLRAVVLSGEGRGFCAGLDRTSFAGQKSGGSLIPADADGDPQRWGDLGVEGLLLGRGQKAVWVWRLIEVPVIAAVHGAAIGAGLQLALGADIRYATGDAKLAAGEINWGLVPDMGGTQLLPALIGLDHARDLIYSGRTVRGDEAARLGLVTAVFDDPLTAATDFARNVAARNPQAIRNAKALTAAAVPVASANLRAERRAMWETIGTPNQLEAVQANIERREPRFVD